MTRKQKRARQSARRISTATAIVVEWQARRFGRRIVAYNPELSEEMARLHFLDIIGESTRRAIREKSEARR